MAACLQTSEETTQVSSMPLPGYTRFANKTSHGTMCSSKIDEGLAGGGVDHLVEGSHTHHG